MSGKDASPPVPLATYRDRSLKRPRLDTQEPVTNQFAFVPQTSFESFGASSSTPEGAKRSHKKPTLSCAECRRLKLKCDRKFPCSACQKRGCAQICPLGALTSGKGSRFILANTEELHTKIAEMSNRIQQLEDGLQTLQISVSAEPHPLLCPDLCLIKSSAQLHRVQTTDVKSGSNSGTDEVHENDTSKSSPSLSFHSPTHEQSYDQMEATPVEPNPQLPAEIYALSEAFPVPWSIDMTMLGRIRDMLPSRPDARYLCDKARQNILWQYNLDPSESFLPNLLHHVYASPLDDLSSRRLALLLMIMAYGLQVDVSPLVDSKRAEAYHHLARAALCAMPVMEHPDLDLMHALFYMIWYLLLFSERDNAPIYAWSIMGLTAKLAQSLGLHRDGAGWKIIPEEGERRQFLLWELLTLDARLALSLSRPPSFSMNHISCKRPNYDIDGLPYAPKPLIYLRWKHDLLEHCLSPVLEAIVSTKPVAYSHILALDGTIRDFYLPPELDMFGREGLSSMLPLRVQQIHVSIGREIVILQLHRNYFTQAMNSPEPFTLIHRYAPSVVATYSSACRLTAILEVTIKQVPKLCERAFSFWFNNFSAVIAMCLFVSRAPHSPISSLVIQDFPRVRRLFLQIAEYSPRAARSYALLEKLVEKATWVFTQFQESRKESQDGSSTVRAQPAISDSRSHWKPKSDANPFEHAHPILQGKSRELMEPQDPSISIPGSGIQLDNEDIRNGSFTTPTPSFDNPLKAGSLDFDYGALTLGPDHQSLMTWF